MDMSFCDVCGGVATRGATGRGHWQLVESGDVIQMCVSCINKVDTFVLEMEKENEDLKEITFSRYEETTDED